MEFYQIERRLKIALDMIRVNDNYLLKEDVNERSITHKLAMYLDHTFGKAYDVDCEYNRNIDHPSNQKRIMLSEYRLESDRLTIIEDVVERTVYPDIIVHKRGKNTHNLLVVEVKKSSSYVSEEYDHEKLKLYTSLNSPSSLRYKYGVFIKFHVKSQNYVEPAIVYFEKGRVSTR